MKEPVPPSARARKSPVAPKSVAPKPVARVDDSGGSSGDARPAPGSLPDAMAVTRLLVNERLVIDESLDSRTCFMSHVGASASLGAGNWVAHRDWVLAMALTNLSPGQRSALARTLRVEYDREFGVGRLVVCAIRSGLPLGGANLWFRARKGGPSCLQVWNLGDDAEPRRCDWMILRARPEWALSSVPRPIQGRGVAAWLELGQKFLIAISDATSARLVADALAGTTGVAAHPRFGPHIADPDSSAPVLLWPSDRLRTSSIDRHEFQCIVVVDGRESVLTAAHDLAQSRVASGRGPVEVVEASCPGVLDRDGMATYWRACGRPGILLRGEPQWVHQGEEFLGSLGAQVLAQSEANQLGLFPGPSAD